MGQGDPGEPSGSCARRLHARPGEGGANLAPSGWYESLGSQPAGDYSFQARSGVQDSAVVAHTPVSCTPGCT